MTDQERQDFVDAVKGKKIRWHMWHKDMYFIPDGTRTRDCFDGEMFPNSGKPYKTDYAISDGFINSKWKYHQGSQAITPSKVGDLFKIGDPVKIIKGVHSGSRGVVDKAKDVNDYYKVSVTGSLYHLFCPESDLELDQNSAPPFKVGDFVVCKPEYDSKYAITTSEVGESEIIEIVDDEYIRIQVLRGNRLASYRVQIKHFEFSRKGDLGSSKLPFKSTSKECKCNIMETGCVCGAIKPYVEWYKR